MIIPNIEVVAILIMMEVFNFIFGGVDYEKIKADFYQVNRKYRKRE